MQLGLNEARVQVRQRCILSIAFELFYLGLLMFSPSIVSKGLASLDFISEISNCPINQCRVSL